MKSKTAKRRRSVPCKKARQTKKPKAITRKIGRRGRKKGDGVLKQIDPADPEDVERKLFLGRAWDDPLAQMVLEIQGIAAQVRHYAEFIESVPAERRDCDARNAIKRKGRYEKALQAHYDTFGRASVMALLDWNHTYFAKISTAIKTVMQLKSNKNYLLYKALFLMKDDWGKNTPRLTFAEVSARLYECLPEHDAYDEAQIRRACKKVGFDLWPSKRGRPKGRKTGPPGPCS